MSKRFGFGMGLGIGGSVPPGAPTVPHVVIGDITDIFRHHRGDTEVFQDTAGLIPATAEGHEVERMNNLAGTGENLLRNESRPTEVPIIDANGNLSFNRLSIVPHLITGDPTLYYTSAPRTTFIAFRSPNVSGRPWGEGGADSTNFVSLEIRAGWTRLYAGAQNIIDTGMLNPANELIISCLKSNGNNRAMYMAGLREDGTYEDHSQFIGFWPSITTVFSLGCSWVQGDRYILDLDFEFFEFAQVARDMDAAEIEALMRSMQDEWKNA